MLITVYITHTLYKCKHFYMSGYLKQWQWNRWKIQRDQWNPGNIITFVFNRNTSEQLHSR